MFNNNFKRNHAKHEKFNTAIKQNSMSSMARRQINGCVPPTIKNWRRRRPRILGGPASAAL